jgi:heme oxygenase
MASNVRTETLAHFLQASFDCYSVLESAIARAFAEENLLTRLEYQPQAATLEEDLRLLDDLDLQSMPVKHQSRHERAYYVGGLYVLIGAQFGKRVIARHVDEQGLAFAEHSKFLNGPGNGWSGLFSALRRETMSAEFFELSMEGAEDYFCAFLGLWQSFSTSRP